MLSIGPVAPVPILASSVPADPSLEITPTLAGAFPANLSKPASQLLLAATSTTQIRRRQLASFNRRSYLAAVRGARSLLSVRAHVYVET
jgi:hypothetical protein